MSSIGTSILRNKVAEEATKQGVDPAIAQAIFLAENSGFDKDGNIKVNSAVDTATTSPKGAVGLMQVMPDTYTALVNQGFIPATNDPNSLAGQVTAGVAAIKELNKRGITSAPEVAAAYNGGGAALQAFRSGQPMNGETTDYLKKVSAHLGTPMATNSTTTERVGTTTRQLGLPSDVAIDLQTSSDKTSAESLDLISQLKQLTQSILGGNTAATTAEDQIAAAKGQQIAGQNMQDNATLNNRESILSTFGLNLNDPDNIVAANTAKVRAIHSERDALSDQITALSSKSPLSDPVGWLMDSLKAAPLISRHNALLNQENSAGAQIEQAQAEAAQQTVLQPAAIRTGVNAKALADTNLALADANAKKAALTTQARATAARTIVETLSTTNASQQNKLQLYHTLYPEISSSDVTSSKDKDDVDALAPVNLALTTLLGGNPDTPGAPPITPVMYRGMTPTTRAALSKYAAYGRLGGSPGEGVALLHEVFGNNVGGQIKANAPDAQVFIQHMVEEGDKEFTGLASQAATNPAIASQVRNAKEPIQQLQVGIDSWVKKKELELKGGNMDNLSPDNPYRLNLNRVASATELANNPIAAALRAKPNLTNNQMALSIAAADVAAGKYSTADAAGYLKDLYYGGMNLQRTSTAAGTLGLKPVGDYPVLLKLFGNRSESVNMFDTTSIEHFLTGQIIAGKVSGGLDTGTNTPRRMPY